MSDDFRFWVRKQRFWEAARDERRAADALERYLIDHYEFHRELRPPCRKCGQWPCVCND